MEILATEHTNSTKSTVGHITKITPFINEPIPIERTRGNPSIEVETITPNQLSARKIKKISSNAIASTKDGEEEQKPIDANEDHRLHIVPDSMNEESIEENSFQANFLQSHRENDEENVSEVNYCSSMEQPVNDPITMTSCQRITRSTTKIVKRKSTMDIEGNKLSKKSTANNTKGKTKANPNNLINIEKKPKKLVDEQGKNKENNNCNMREDEKNQQNNITDEKKTNIDKKSKINLKAHQDEFIRKWKSELECVQCEAVFDSLVTLRMHFRREHSPHKCYILCCQRKLFTRTQIVEHITLHIDPNSFKCDLCGKRFSEKRTLLKHHKEKHTMEGLSRRFKCTVCNKAFTKLSILRCHEDMHATGSKDHVCDLCGKAFVLAKRLKVHMRTTHGADRICDQCGRIFRSQRALQDHLLEHAGVAKPKWECDLCDVALNSHASLKRHKEVRHNDGSKEFICDICGKVTSSTYALRSHKKYVHQAIRKHKCNICGKAFKVAIVLREHMASHTGNDLYKCPYCPKTFKVSSNMHHHRKKIHPVEWAEAREKKFSSIIHINDDSSYKTNLLNT